MSELTHLFARMHWPLDRTTANWQYSLQCFHLSHIYQSKWE